MKSRILCVSFYLGLAPLLAVSLFRREKDQVIKHHYRQSLAIFLILLCIFIFYLCYFTSATVLLLYSSEIYQSFPFDIVLFVISACLFLLWLLLWTYGVFQAVRGSIHNIPFTSRIINNKTLMSISLGWEILLFASIAVSAIFTTFSTRLAYDHLEPCSTYMLYDDMGFIPHWAFTLAFYRMSLATTERWGKGSVVVAPLSKWAINYAFQNGRVVFVASHGTEGLIKISRWTNERFGPKDVNSEDIGSELQFVYLAGCNSGKLGSEWKNALRPAEAKTFDRLSANAEHLSWLWNKGPRLIHTLR
jgi:hypothetical protein